MLGTPDISRRRTETRQLKVNRRKRPLEEDVIDSHAQHRGWGNINLNSGEHFTFRSCWLSKQHYSPAYFFVEAFWVKIWEYIVVFDQIWHFLHYSPYLRLHSHDNIMVTKALSGFFLSWTICSGRRCYSRIKHCDCCAPSRRQDVGHRRGPRPA